MMRCFKRGLLWGLLLLLLYQGWILLHVWWWVDHNPESTAFMQDRLEVLQQKAPAANIHHQWVPYRHISPHLKRAVIAAEDAKFNQHHGFDWKGIQKAYEKNIERGRVVAGGSTISQQLAKNLFLSAWRSPLRKLQEAVITVMLEQLMSKQRILEIYLNMIEWGHDTFGAEAAARHYFGTSAARLDPDAAARLAAMIPNPRYYESHPGVRALARHAATIRARMAQVEVP